MPLVGLGLVGIERVERVGREQLGEPGTEISWTSTT